MSGRNHDSWPPEILAELEAGTVSHSVGKDLLSENERVRIWALSLEPGERIGFHRHVLDYFWTATSNGRSRSHYSDGRIADTIYRKGDTRHFHFARGEFMVHDLLNTGDDVLSFVTVEFKDSENEPLPLDREPS